LAHPDPLASDAPDQRTPLRLAYLGAALAGKRGAAWDATIEARRQGLSIEGVYRELLIWTQRRIGELWASAQITVAAEHMASSVTQSVMGRLYADIPGDRPAGHALIAGAEGELHALPAHLASDLLEIDGWNVAFVGTNVPEASLLAALTTEKPDVLGLSVTMAFNLPRTVALVQAVRSRFATLPVVIGGRAVLGAVSLGGELGVDVDSAGDFAAFQGYRRGG
ncbi:MAG: cobalamin-dependent protein, partial [Minicystis sp.]